MTTARFSHTGSTGFSRQRGFSLLEALLAIGVLSLLLTGLYGQFDSWSQRAVNRRAATDVLRLQNAAEDYVQANSDALKASPLDTFIELDIDDLKTANYLPSSYTPLNALRQDMRTFFRVQKLENINNDTGAGNGVFTYRFEVTTVSEGERVPPKRLMDTAIAGGPRMGVITQSIPGGTKVFTDYASSLYSEWFYPLSDLASAIDIDGNASPYTATSDADGFGYVAAYGVINTRDTDPNDAWLYRMPIDGRPELNRMEGNLLMNANRIDNVGNLVADRVAVTGDATFMGNATDAQAMTVEQALLVDGTEESRINMKPMTSDCGFVDAGGGNRDIVGAGCSGTSADVYGGDLNVVSAADNATLGVGTLTSSGDILTEQSNVDGAVNARGSSSFQTLTGFGNLAATGQVVAPTTDIGGTVTTTDMQAENLSLTSGSINTANLTNTFLNPGATHNVTTGTLSIGGSVELTGNVRTNASLTGTGAVSINGVSGNFWDSAVGRQVLCTAQGGRTYCEPNGSRTKNGITENCAQNGNGYTCTYSGGASGSCVYTRNGNGYNVNCS